MAGAPEGETEHYFTARPRSASAPHELRFLYRGAILTFEVDRGVFAAHGLDPGTALLIQALDLTPTESLLDLGCGWGAVGVAAARSAPRGRVVLTDVNRRAVHLAQTNLRRNKVANAEVRVGPLFEPVTGERFDVIATNPPYHVGRPSILELLGHAPEHLAPGGRLLIVGKGSHGIRFYQAWLAEHWAPDVEVAERQSGYRVLRATAARPNRQA
ncbi:MAG TPA: methyltransferase [Thermoplasmata archaeon]|nr:methyltransferase [Thermoplasmata archaeon]